MTGGHQARAGNLPRDLEFILDQHRLEAPLAALPARDRWDLLLDSLLGHAASRHGRARDQPFSALARTSMAVCRQLMERRHPFTLSGRGGHAGVTEDISQYDVVSALRIVECVDRAQDGAAPRGEAFHEALMIALLRDVLAQGTTIEAWEPMAERLGLLDPHPERLSQGGGGAAANLILLARSLVLIAVASHRRGLPVEAVLDEAQLHENRRQRLMAGDLVFLRVKTRRVQSDILKFCRTAALHRGASALCSSVLGHVRDTLTRAYPASIFMDCDAASVFVSPRPMDGGAVLETLRSSLHPQEASLPTAWFPRLAPYEREARAIQLDIERPLPQVDAAITTAHVSLLDLASPGLAFEFLEGPVTERPEAEPDDEWKCTGVEGTASYRTAEWWVPDWYVRGSERFGWAATVYSMAGRVARLDVREAMRRGLRDRRGLQLALPRTHVKLAQQFEAADVCLVKLDGDGVGTRFRDSPVLLQPRLSVGIGLELQWRLDAAIDALTAPAGTTHLALDPIYLGGDDVLVAVPSSMLAVFLDAFLAPIPAADWAPGLRYTFAVLCVPVARRAERDGVDRIAIALRLLPKLLRLAKAHRKGLTPVPDQASMDAHVVDGERAVFTAFESMGAGGGIIARLAP